MTTTTTAPTRLSVSENKRYIVNEEGRPFFWLGDTAWSVFQRLTREDASHYLADRAARGFTVIMAPALPPSGYRRLGRGLETKNRYGELPLHDMDPRRPNANWFDLVEYVIDAAAEAGLYVGLLPSWAEYVAAHDQWDTEIYGPVVFDPGSTRWYGEWIGARFRDKTNLLWVLGGDRNPPGDEEAWRAMAEGIAYGVTGERPDWNEAHPAWERLVMTYHATGGYLSSSLSFHTDAWLGTNMIQTWAHEQNIIPHVKHDYDLTPPKPTIVGEPSYEGFIEGNPNTSSPWRVRYQAYWSLFTGAHGHVYGNHEIWPFSEKWRDELAAPGADDMRHVRSLVESRPMLTRVPEYGMITSEAGEGHEIRLATRSSDGAYAFVYLTSGGAVAVDLAALSGESANAYWYDPREGSAATIGTFGGEGTREFVAPSSGDDNDWVLVLDDASRGFGVPGGGARA